jgi:dephospho-CoA kinase
VTAPVAVAVTGGIGAGKSTVLASFARQGAAVVSSDEIVHELLRRDDIRAAVTARFGNGVVSPGGELDRGAIGSVVFADPEALVWLESLLHPLVSAEYLHWREQLAALPQPPRVCVTEVPLLYEAGSERYFDRVVVVTAPDELRRSRSAAAVSEREQRLLPDEEKAARADFVYVNSGALAELDAFVASVLAELSGEVRLS